MQTELETMIREFMEKNRKKWGNDSYSAGYLGSLIWQLASEDKALNKKLIRWFTHERENV